ncbi:MAG TPA: hypothetical protein VND68_13545 [Chloroflexia bacterium]|jgi:hypothetical protein|nr:hypothetical protein [Chloroflexia bacterium]
MSTDPWLTALRAVFGPIVKQSSKWPPILAYGLPGIIAVLLIVALRETLPSNVLWLVAVVILAPLLGFIILDVDTRRHPSPQNIALTGVVLSSDGFPIKDARVSIDGSDRIKETDDNGSFSIQVDRQEAWTVRAVYKQWVVSATVKRMEINKPVSLVLDVAIANATQEAKLQAVYRIGPLDGRTPINFGGQEYYAEGCKFKLQFDNLSSVPVVLDTLALRLKEYKPLPQDVVTTLDAGAMRFGNARIPHQLYLELRTTHWKGRWIVNQDNDSQVRDIPPDSSNLLDVDPPILFQIAPEDTELISGAIKAEEPGLYAFAFYYEYRSIGGNTSKASTQLVYIADPTA